jgi:hypothetical protein
VALVAVFLLAGLLIGWLGDTMPGLSPLPANTSVGDGPEAGAWAGAILAALGVSPTAPADVRSLVAWFRAEDGDHPAGASAPGAGENDPLNITAASSTFAGVTGTEPSGAGPGHPGNLDFATPGDGIAATARVISERYPAIARALRSGRGLIGNPDVSAELAKWSGGGYDALGLATRTLPAFCLFVTLLCVVARTLASDDRSLMSHTSKRTTPEVRESTGSGRRRHRGGNPVTPPPVVPPVAPPATPPVTPPPVKAPPVTTSALTSIPAETAVGTGALATAWGTAILAQLGASANAACLASMLAWFAAEDDGQPQGSQADGTGANNPLDVTEDSGSFTGSVGSEPSGAGPGYPGNIDFDTPAHGVAATATVIKSYSAIYAALMSGAGLIGNSAVSANLSEWSGGGYSSLN